MKRIALFFAMLMVVSLSGCSKDAQVEAFLTEFDTVTKDVVAKIDANPSSAGVDEAQKALDARKTALQTKWDAIKDAVGLQVSKDTKRKLESSVQNNVKALVEVGNRNAVKLAADKDAVTKFQHLIQDFSSTFAPPTARK